MCCGVTGHLYGFLALPCTKGKHFTHTEKSCPNSTHPAYYTPTSVRYGVLLRPKNLAIAPTFLHPPRPFTSTPTGVRYSGYLKKTMYHEQDVPLSCASSPPCGRTKNWITEMLQAVGNLFSNCCGNFGGWNEVASSQGDGADGGVDVDPPAATRHVQFDETTNKVRHYVRF